MRFDVLGGIRRMFIAERARSSQRGKVRRGEEEMRVRAWGIVDAEGGASNWADEGGCNTVEALVSLA
eukprot:4197314-Pleurochrysis_carterae.AAC.1